MGCVTTAVPTSQLSKGPRAITTHEHSHVCGAHCWAKSVPFECYVLEAADLRHDVAAKAWRKLRVHVAANFEITANFDVKHFDAPALRTVLN